MKSIVKSTLNRALSKAFGLKLYSIKAHGREDMVDIVNTGLKIGMCFDVGANAGQTITKLVSAFPDAEVHAFEPVKKTYDLIRSRFASYNNLTLNQLALGDRNAEMDIYVPQHDTMASLVKPSDYVESEQVRVQTLDAYCDEHNIATIDLLKIDAEGYDLQVLKGATTLLENQAIKLVLVELGFDPKSSYHVPFDIVHGYLADYGFDVFGIYDQQLEWSGEKKLRYANVCFINLTA